MAIAFNANLGAGDFLTTTPRTLTTTAAAAAASRVIVFASYFVSGAPATGLTIGGAAATLDKRTTNGSDIFDIWSLHVAGGLASGSAITLTGGVGGGLLMGAVSFTGVTTTGAVVTTASATGTAASWSSGAATNTGFANALYAGGAGNEDVTDPTSSTPVNGTEIHDRYRNLDGQGFVTGYTIAATVLSRSITGTFSNANSTSNTGALVIYSAAGGAASNPLAGTIAAAATVTAAATVLRPLTGAVAAVSASAATLTAAARLTGTAATVSTVTSALSVAAQLTGTAATASTATATLTVAAAVPVLLGSSSPPPVPAATSISDGMRDAHEFTATADGTITAFRFRTNGVANTGVTSVRFGFYNSWTDFNASLRLPDTRMSDIIVTTPGGPAVNSEIVAAANLPVIKGARYFISVLPIGGDLNYDYQTGAGTGIETWSNIGNTSHADPWGSPGGRDDTVEHAPVYATGTLGVPAGTAGTQPSGFTVLSDSAAAALVSRTTPPWGDPRGGVPGQATAINRAPTTPELDRWKNRFQALNLHGSDAGLLARFMAITGNHTLSSATTDELIRWTANKFGIHEDAARAVVRFESYWYWYGNSDYHETWYVYATGATSGSFTLTPAGYSPVSIAWNSTAAAAQTALEARVGVGNVAVTGRSGPLPGAGLAVAFSGALASNTGLTVNSAGLAGATAQVKFGHFILDNGAAYPLGDKVTDNEDHTYSFGFVGVRANSNSSNPGVYGDALFDGTYPLAKLIGAFATSYWATTFRAYLDDAYVALGGPTANGDMWRALGLWYAGWGSGPAWEGYIAGYASEAQRFIAQRVWETPGFVSTAGPPVTPSVTVPLAGTITATSTVTAAPKATKPLAAAITAASTITAAATTTKAAAGAITGTSAVTAAATSTAALASTITSVATVTAALTVSAPLTGTAAGTSTVNAALTATAAGTTPLAGTITSTATSTGAVTVTRPLTGSITAVSTITASPVSRAALTGTITASATATGTAGTSAPLTATVNAASTITGALTVAAAGTNPLAGTIASTATLTGAVTVQRKLTGSITAAGAVTAALTARVNLTANPTVASSTTAGTIKVSYPLAGAVTVTTGLAGAIIVIRPLTGAITGSITAAATLTNLPPVTAVGRIESAALTTGSEAAGYAKGWEGAGVSRAPGGTGSAVPNEPTGGLLALIE